MQHQPHEPSLQGLLESAGAFLAAATLPAGPFDPAGAWKQNYAVWMKDRQEGWTGALALQRGPRQDGEFDLQVDWRVRQSTKVVHHVQAAVVCQADELATPRSWKSQSRILQPSGQAIDDLTVAQEAVSKDGVVELSDGRRLFADRPLKAWTSNWSLLEAVQRIAPGRIKPLSFSMLEFLDVRKDGQCLSYLGQADVDFGARKAHLSGYQHLGAGVLPWEYWLDEHRRLVVVRSGLVGYLAVEDGPKS